MTEYIKELVFIIAIGFDVLTGVITALALGDWTSSKMREGLTHKLGEVLGLILIEGISIGAPYLGVELPFDLTSVYIIPVVVMEIGSIVENILKLNPDLKDILTKVLEKLKGGQ